MSAQEGFIQVAPDSTGKSVANVTITRADGTVVYRQEIVLADAEINDFRAAVTKYGELRVDHDQFDVHRRSDEQVQNSLGDQTLMALRTRHFERTTLSDRRGQGLDRRNRR